MKTAQADSGWEVEWCDFVARDADGIDPETAQYRTKDFRSQEAAVKFARKVLPQDVFGSVRVSHFYSEPYEPGYPGCYREYDGEAEYIEA